MIIVAALLALLVQTIRLRQLQSLHDATRTVLLAELEVAQIVKEQLTDECEGWAEDQRRRLGMDDQWTA